MLIDEIIDLLSNEKSSLSEALLKTKVLMHKVGKKELAEWVNHELNGYSDASALPEYRKLSAKVKGNASNIAYRLPNRLLPINHLDESVRESLQTMVLMQPLSVLEDMASKTEGSITRSLAPEYNGAFNEALDNGFAVENVWCETPLHDVKGVITQIRSRLLDFILELKDAVGDTADEKAKEKIASVDTNSLFQNAIFGPNAVIMVGNQNEQNVGNILVQNNLDALVKTLSEIGIPSNEIENLKIAINNDEKTHGKASYEGEAGKWYTKMLGRAAKGTLGVGIDVVSTGVGKALASFMGF